MISFVDYIIALFELLTLFFFLSPNVRLSLDLIVWSDERHSVCTVVHQIRHIDCWPLAGLLSPFGHWDRMIAFSSSHWYCIMITLFLSLHTLQPTALVQSNYTTSIISLSWNCPCGSSSVVKQRDFIFIWLTAVWPLPHCLCQLFFSSGALLISHALTPQFVYVSTNVFYFLFTVTLLFVAPLLLW